MGCLPAVQAGQAGQLGGHQGQGSSAPVQLDRDTGLRKPPKSLYMLEVLICKLSAAYDRSGRDHAAEQQHKCREQVPRHTSVALMLIINVFERPRVTFGP